MSLGLIVIRRTLIAARLAGTVFGFTIVVFREFVKYLLKSASTTSIDNSPPMGGLTSPGNTRATDINTCQAVTPSSGILHEVSEGSSAFCSFIKGGCTVDMRLYLGATSRIESVMKVPRERLHWMRARNAFERVKLDVYTADIAAAAGLPFTFQGAQKFILNATGAKVLNVPEQPRRITSPLDSVSSIPHTRFESIDGSNATIEITGTVVSVGSAVVRPAKGNAYTTFTVVVMTSTGDVSLSGIDLKEKFELRQYGVGDLVAIKKARAEFSIEDRGVQKKRSKNSYEVTVLQKAAG